MLKNKYMREFVNAEIVEFLDDRFYKVDGKYYPSATTILSMYPKGKQFEQWLKDVGNSAQSIMERAADSGSRVHDAIERILSKEVIRWDDTLVATKYHGTHYTLEEWQMLLRFMEFYTMYKPEVIFKEKTIVSKKYGFAGTLDLVCKIDNLVYLIDYKTGKSVYETHFMQLSAYKEGLAEEGTIVDRAGILHLQASTRKTDKEKFQGEGWKVDFGEAKDYFKIFKSVLDIYMFENPEVKPKNLAYPIEIKI